MTTGREAETSGRRWDTRTVAPMRLRNQANCFIEIWKALPFEISGRKIKTISAASELDPGSKMVLFMINKFIKNKKNSGFSAHVVMHHCLLGLESSYTVEPRDTNSTQMSV